MDFGSFVDFGPFVLLGPAKQRGRRRSVYEANQQKSLWTTPSTGRGKRTLGTFGTPRCSPVLASNKAATTTLRVGGIIRGRPLDSFMRKITTSTTKLFLGTNRAHEGHRKRKAKRYKKIHGQSQQQVTSSSGNNHKTRSDAMTPSHIPHHIKSGMKCGGKIYLSSDTNII